MKKRLSSVKNSPATPPACQSPHAGEPHSKVSLRQKAEAHFRMRESGWQEKIDSLSPESMRTILHELQVHRIELEMQNEELCVAHAELDASRSRYFDLYNLAPVGYCTLSEQGMILEANLTAAPMFGVDLGALVKQPITRFIFNEDQDIFYKLRQRLMKTREPQSCELRMVKPGGTAVWTLLKATLSRDEGGNPTCRCTFDDITERKRGELDSATLAAIVRSSDDAIISKDLNGIVTSWNQAAEKLFGYTSAEMVGTSILRLIPADRLQEAQGILEKIKGGNPVDHFETLRQTKGGNLLAVSITASPIKNAAGTVVGVSKVAREITERKRMEALLRASEEKYRSLFESMIDGFVTVAMDGKLLEFNEVYRSMLGYSRTEMARLTYMDITPEKWSAFEADIVGNQILKRGYSDVYEKEYRRKDGSIFPVELHAVLIRDEQGNPEAIWSVIRDVTMRKRAEINLVKLSAELETIFNSVPAMIWYKDDKNNFLRVNQAAAQAMGMSAAEIEEKSAYDLLPNEAEHYYEDDREVLASGKPKLNIIERLQTASGEPRWIQTDKVPYRDETGNIIGVIVISVDITERKRAEEELLQKNAELESFTYTVSHDLKSPLVTIKTFLGYLEEDLKTNRAETVAKDLEYLHVAADKMELLLNELLKLARIGHLRNPPVVAPLQEIVGEALELVAGQIAEREVQVEVAKEPVWLHGDRQRLVQLFQNLVDNAVKFLGDQPNPRIGIGVEQEGGEIVLFVRDNGKGIDPRHRSKLFGLFEKLDPHTPGAGMGLATARRIVEMHGGTIQAQSDGPGKGSSFRFTLAKTEWK